MRRKRRTHNNLSVAEQRVLEAFYCGRLAAGRLSAALAEARREAAEPVRVPVPQAVVAEPAPALQLAA